jgi:hypothetical protein
MIMVGCLSISTAEAACKGTNGRGWGSGHGAGKFSMTAADKVCNISFPGFINGKKRTAAKKVTVTRKPKSGKLAVVAEGMVYTPAAGFKGKDKFCTRNKAAGVSGTLSGCVTITVR